MESRYSSQEQGELTIFIISKKRKSKKIFRNFLKNFQKKESYLVDLLNTYAQYRRFRDPYLTRLAHTSGMLNNINIHEKGKMLKTISF